MTILGEFPTNIRATKQYGANLVAFASALSTVGMVSVDRIHKLLNNVFQVGISTGAIQGFLNRLHEKVKLPVKYIRNKVSQVPVMNCDETGVRVNEKLRWLHCMSGSGWVYYALHDKRGCEAMDEIGIIPDYHGIMIHDCWKPYFKYEKAEHALCCAHILRELVYAEEVKHQQWAKPLRELLCEMLTERNRLAELGESRFSKEQADAYSSRYDALVTQGLEANPLYICRASLYFRAISLFTSQPALATPILLPRAIAEVSPEAVFYLASTARILQRTRWRLPAASILP